MKNKLILATLLIVIASLSFGCRKEVLISRTENQVSRYWILDKKIYDDYDLNGRPLGTETHYFNSDSYYDFQSRGQYNGLEVENGAAYSVSGYYTVLNNSALLMDYDGFTDTHFQIVELTSGTMVISTTYTHNNVETDETLYFYR